MDANPTQSDNSAAAARIVKVGLGARSYDIVIGPALLTRAGELIQEHAPARKCAIVSDKTVAGLHLQSLMAGLGGHIDVAGTVIVPPGEASKDFTQLERVCGELLDLGVERDDLVIAFGGGVTGDLAGFAAAILRRGVRLIQIPTTLLAQVDSSVGGKTGINTAHGKNLIGAFHQPSLVLADTGILETLPERQFRSGYAEVVKYGLLGDADFFSWLDINRTQVFSQGDALIQAVVTSCKAKAQIVEEDELEMGRRALLNLGHTFGHALEAFAGYSDRLLHGEGVSIGMALAFEFSTELGLCPSQECERAITHLRAAGLPVRISDIPGQTPQTAELMKLIGQDKKVQGGVPVFILARGVGDAFIERGVERGKLEDFLTRKCRET
jgi:3-dehydroquinate synthase